MPQPVTWAVATALASLLAVTGMLIVWVPLSGYLLVDGHPARAVLLALWAIAPIVMSVLVAAFRLSEREVGMGSTTDG